MKNLSTHFYVNTKRRKMDISSPQFRLWNLGVQSLKWIKLLKKQFNYLLLNPLIEMAAAGTSLGLSVDDESIRPQNFHTDVNFLELPDDVLFSVFKKCDIKTLGRLSRVCQKLNSLIKCDSVWLSHRSLLLLVGSSAAQSNSTLKFNRWRNFDIKDKALSVLQLQATSKAIYFIMKGTLLIKCICMPCPVYIDAIIDLMLLMGLLWFRYTTVWIQILLFWLSNIWFEYQHHLTTEKIYDFFQTWLLPSQSNSNKS